MKISTSRYIHVQGSKLIIGNISTQLSQPARFEFRSIYAYVAAAVELSQSAIDCCVIYAARAHNSEASTEVLQMRRHLFPNASRRNFHYTTLDAFDVLLYTCAEPPLLSAPYTSIYIYIYTVNARTLPKQHATHLFEKAVLSMWLFFPSFRRLLHRDRTEASLNSKS